MSQATKVTLTILAAVLIGVGGVVWLIARSVLAREPLPLADRCRAEVGGATATLEPEQAYYAALIAGVSVKRELPPRAASIAIATAFQESSMRNLDYGHADSIGLFQQRPSQGWGSVEEIMDPWYSSGRFYKELVKVKGWKTGDLNDVAQAVQRSGHPEAYRKHVERSRILASALAGETPASFSCSVNSPGAADPKGMRSYLTKTLGSTVKVTRDGETLVVTATEPSHAWAGAHLAIAGTQRYGLHRVDFGTWGWEHDTGSPAPWRGSGSTALTQFRLTFS